MFLSKQLARESTRLAVVALAAFLTSCGPGEAPGPEPRPGSASGVAAPAPAARDGGPAPRFLWLEGEEPASANVKLNLAGWGNKQFLSGEKWLHVSLEADKVEKELPAEGGPDPLRLRREGRGRPRPLGAHRLRVRTLPVRLAAR